MDAEAIRELFAVFGPVTVRRMFGGAGIYADGTMFALVADGVIYLKADEQNVPAFEREQLEPFTYATKDGRRGVMSYRRMPDRLYDDPDTGRRIPPVNVHGMAWDVDRGDPAAATALNPGDPPPPGAAIVDPEAPGA